MIFPWIPWISPEKGLYLQRLGRVWCANLGDCRAALVTLEVRMGDLLMIGYTMDTSMDIYHSDMTYYPDMKYYPDINIG